MDSLLSFPVGLSHPLQHAGLSRRSPGCPLERSRLRGGRFASNTPGVMRHDRTPISMELLLARVTLLHMIEIP